MTQGYCIWKKARGSTTPDLPSNAIALTRGGNRVVQPARRRYGRSPYLLSTASLLLARFDQVRIGSIDATIITDGSCFSV
jgi:hypothetical protein